MARVPADILEGSSTYSSAHQSSASLGSSLFFKSEPREAPDVFRPPSVIQSLNNDPEEHKERRIIKWLDEQSTAVSPPRPQSMGSSYTPCPILPLKMPPPLEEDDASSIADYVLIDEDDIRDIDMQVPRPANPTPPHTPSRHSFHMSFSRHTRTSSSLSQDTSIWRSLRISTPRKLESTTVDSPSSPPRTPKRSLFRRHPLPQPFSTPPLRESARSEPSEYSPASTTPRNKRISSISNTLPGKFAIPIIVPHNPSPRPSISTDTTCPTEHYAPNLSHPEKHFSKISLSLSQASSVTHNFSNYSLESKQFARLPPPSSPLASRSSLFSVSDTPRQVSMRLEVPTVEGTLMPPKAATLSRKTSRMFRDLAQIPTLGLSPVSGVPVIKTAGTRRRKLVVSGIPPNDDNAVEGVRKWCEGFGELRRITRVKNGDLHVDFEKSDVAEMVCRLRARVSIAGVGSVALSWYTGKKPA